MIRSFTTLTIGASLCVFSAPAVRAQINQASRLAGEPPKILNVVHQLLIPGKESAYSQLLDHIAETYDQTHIPVYWIQAQSLTGYLHLQEIARNAYVSWDSEIYIVSAASSRVWDDFAAGDPQFWRAAKR
jgi:hypothetical protein